MLILHYIKKYGKYLPAIILIVRFGLISAQEVVVKAELDTNRALIGDQLHLFLSVEKPVDLRMDFPGLKDTITRKIEIISDSFTDTVSVSENRVTFGRNLLITVFDTGSFTVPPLDFLVYAEPSPDTIRTLPIAFMILPVKTDTTLRDIKGNFKTPVNMAEILYYMKKDYPYGLLLAGIGLLTLFIVRYIRKRRRQGKDIQKEKPVEMPEIIALRELEKIRNEKPWMHNKVKLYYINVSDILRHYIEGRYHIMALEQTTGEILQALKSTACANSDLNNLGGILKLADLVKFAKVKPSVEENALQVDLATEFVRNTSAQEAETRPENVPQEDLIHHNIETNA